MNIYFACSITGGREDESIYEIIVAALIKDGHSIPTAHLSQQDVLELETILNPVEVYARDTGWIESCDALIAEVSTPSHGVGYEIAFALQLGKPVLCIYQEGRQISKMLTGNTHPNICVKAYRNQQEILQILHDFPGKIPPFNK